MLLKCIDNEVLFNSKMRKGPECIDFFTKTGVKLFTGAKRIVELKDRLFIETPIANVYMSSIYPRATKITSEGIEIQSMDRQIRNIMMCLKQPKTRNKTIGMAYIRLNGLYIIE